MEPAYERDGFANVRKAIDTGLVRELDSHIDWCWSGIPNFLPKGSDTS